MFLNVDRNSIKDFWNISLLGHLLKLISWNEVSKFGIHNLWEIINLQTNNNSILIKEIETNKATPDISTFTPVLYDVETFNSRCSIRNRFGKVRSF